MNAGHIIAQKYRLCQERKQKLVRFISENPRFIAATAIYVAFVWPVVMFAILLVGMLGMSITLTSAVLTAFFTPFIVIVFETVLALWGIIYVLIWVSNIAVQLCITGRIRRKVKTMWASKKPQEASVIEREPELQPEPEHKESTQADAPSEAT